MEKRQIRQETFDYHEKEAFVVLTGKGWNARDEHLLSHWHEELEVAYVADGHFTHYIEGKRVESKTGSLVVTDPGSVHCIIDNKEPKDSESTYVVILLIPPYFLERFFPEYRTTHFTNEHIQVSPEVGEVMFRLGEYSQKSEHENHDYLYATGLVIQMLYYICQTGTSSKNVMEDSRKQEQQAQLKGVLEYIRDHYGEHICQDKVAEQFYFSKSYFPKCFKRYTGLSFAEYITRYRVEQARIALLSTEDSVLEIALRCGFCDSRRLILNFKKQYEMTPAMYRKKIKEPAQK